MTALDETQGLGAENEERTSTSPRPRRGRPVGGDRRSVFRRSGPRTSARRFGAWRR